jgi:hypothetical protein
VSGIRPFAPGDLEQVAALYERTMRSGRSRPPAGLAPYLGRVFLDGPGLAPGMAPLVYEANGRIQGFIGAQVRPFRHEGVPVPVVVSGPLFTEPGAWAASALLAKAVFEGPQALTIADGATAESVKLVERLSGCVHGLAVVRWTRIFRPWRLASHYLARRPGMGRLWKPFDLLGRPLWAAADKVTPGFRWSAPATALVAEPLDGGRLVEGLSALAPHYRLHADYDVETSEWLLREAAGVTNRGPLRGRLLRDPKRGHVVGWYLYYAPKGRIGQVVQVAALPREYEAVLSHLFADADARGVAALQGRLASRLVAPLRVMGTRLHYDASLVVVHSRDRDIQAAIFAGDALLSRLDGEWCFGFQHMRLNRAGAASGVAAGPSRRAVPIGS